MSSPLLFIIIVGVIDLFLKSSREKKKKQQKMQGKMPNVDPRAKKKRSRNTIDDLRRGLVEEFERQRSKIEDKDIEDTFEKTEEPQTAKRRERSEEKAREARRKLIEDQRKKTNKHSGLDRSNRLHRERDRKSVV